MFLPQSHHKNDGHGSEKYSDSKVTEVALERVLLSVQTVSPLFSLAVNMPGEKHPPLFTLEEAVKD